MQKLKRLILCHTDRTHRQRNGSARVEVDVPRTTAAPDGRYAHPYASHAPSVAMAVAPAPVRVTVGSEIAHGRLVSAPSTPPPWEKPSAGLATTAVASAGEVGAGSLQTAKEIPKGPAAWKHKSITVAVPPSSEPRDGGSQSRPYKRRRRGRRGRRRRANPVGACAVPGAVAATMATRSELKVQPLQFIIRSEDQMLRSSASASEDEDEDEDTVGGEQGSVDTAVDARDARTKEISNDAVTVSRAKAFNLTYLKQELLSLQEALTMVQSLRKSVVEERLEKHDDWASVDDGGQHEEDDGRSEDLIAQGMQKLKGKVQSLIESVSRAESAQWSNLESNAPAKGRRPR